MSPMLAYVDNLQGTNQQCDAARYGLGAVIFLEGRPIAYASCSGQFRTDQSSNFSFSEPLAQMTRNFPEWCIWYYSIVRMFIGKNISQYKATLHHFQLKFLETPYNYQLCRMVIISRLQPMLHIPKEYIYTMVGTRTNCNYYQVTTSRSFHCSPSSSDHVHFYVRIISARENCSTRNCCYT